MAKMTLTLTAEESVAVTGAREAWNADPDNTPVTDDGEYLKMRIQTILDDWGRRYVGEALQLRKDIIVAVKERNEAIQREVAKDKRISELEARLARN